MDQSWGWGDRTSILTGYHVLMDQSWGGGVEPGGVLEPSYSLGYHVYGPVQG